MRDEKRNRTEMFVRAFKLLIANKRLKSQKELAAETGISVPFISQVKNDKRYPAYDTQVAIARAYGKSLDEFISVTDTAHLTDTADVDHYRGGKLIYSSSQEHLSDTADHTRPETPDNIHLLPAREKSIQTPEELQAQSAHKNLDIVLQSGDLELISAIVMNLTMFKRSVEQARQVAEQGERIRILEENARR